MSTNKNNKNNDNNINAYKDFRPGIAKENECYKQSKMEVSSITRDGKTIIQTIPYTKIPDSDKDNYWPSFVASIKNPETNEFYPQRDTTGAPIVQPNGKSNAEYIVKQIVRFRKRDNSEWLYSHGFVCGFNSLGARVYTSIQPPEIWERPIFETDRKFNPKSNSIQDITKGVTGVETVYELPFTPENFDKLYAQAVGVNGNKIPGPQNSDIYHPEFVVKDEAQGGVPIGIGWVNVEETRRLFRNKGFEFLYNGNYIPDPVKADMRAKSEALIGEKREVPTVTKDSENYKGYTL